MLYRFGSPQKDDTGHQLHYLVYCGEHMRLFAIGPMRLPLGVELHEIGANKMISEGSLRQIADIFCGDTAGFYSYKTGSQLVSF